jgi:hypothetical protein
MDFLGFLKMDSALFEVGFSGALHKAIKKSCPILGTCLYSLQHKKARLTGLVNFTIRIVRALKF